MDIFSDLKRRFNERNKDILQSKVTRILDSIGFDKYNFSIKDHNNMRVTVNLKFDGYDNVNMEFKYKKSTITLEIFRCDPIFIYPMNGLPKNGDYTQFFPSREAFMQFLSIFCKCAFNVDISDDSIENQEWFRDSMKKELLLVEKLYDLEDIFILDNEWARFDMGDTFFRLVLKFHIDILRGENTKIFYHINLVLTASEICHVEFEIQPFGTKINGKSTFAKLNMRYFPKEWNEEKAKNFLTDIAINLLNGTSPCMYLKESIYQIDGPQTIFDSH